MDFRESGRGWGFKIGESSNESFLGRWDAGFYRTRIGSPRSGLCRLACHRTRYAVIDKLERDGHFDWCSWKEKSRSEALLAFSGLCEMVRMVRMVGEGEQTLWYHSTRWSRTVEKGSIPEELIAGLMWYNTVNPEPNLPSSLTPVGEDWPPL